MSKEKGLYDNINAKRKRIAKGSGEKMRKPGEKGAPSKRDFAASAKTAKKGSGKAKSGRSKSGQSSKSKSRTKGSSK